MDRRGILVALGGLGAAAASSARSVASDLNPQELYRQFYTAQNRRDIPAVREMLIDSPDFLWVSDGKAFWGRETMLARMSAYQKADVWVVQPDFERARLVDIAPGAACLFQPLNLTLGPQQSPHKIAFLVNILFRQTAQGWKIAALLTTEENPV